MQPKVAALRKRVQIANANKVMFIWVAAVSALMGIAVVGSMFLIQKISFNEKVLKEKSNTISVLKKNNKNILELNKQVAVLKTNKLLTDLKAGPADNETQVILDALPSFRNPDALGASLQDRLLNVPGINLESMNVEDVDDLNLMEGSTGGTSVDASSAESIQTGINFSFAVLGSEADLGKLLQNLERSIRTINIVSLKIEKQSLTDNAGATSEVLNIKVTGNAYYESERAVKLKDKEIRS